MEIDYSRYDNFRKDLGEIDNLIRITPTQQQYIPNSDHWRNIPSSQNFSSNIHSVYIPMYKNGIDCDLVYPNIFIGNIFAAETTPFLKDIGVTHVLNCAVKQCLKDEKYYMDSNIKFKGLELEDIYVENIARFFDEACQFIHEAITSGGKILVHCLAGVSRSATITIAYLMKYENFTLKDAIVRIKTNRPINPNEGFLKQLLVLDYELRKNRYNIIN